MKIAASEVKLQPRPKLFWSLMILLALWVAALLWMYFATVYPARHPAQRSTSRPSATMPA